MWKATAAYNFFQTESSHVALFFLMFGREAAVKHTLLATESLKYLGSEEGILDIELMKELFHIVAFNLDKARKARDNNKPRKAKSTPQTLKSGDNVLVRDHTSKVFQPKYKDFCIVKIIGKNQVEVKDNHSHTMKVHRKDVKKVQMIDKVSDLYSEEQDSNVRSCRKILSIHKTPDLQWKLTENTEIDEVRYTPTGATLTCIILIVALIAQLGKSLFQVNRKAATTACKLAKKATRATRHLIKRNSIANMYKFGKQTGFRWKSYAVNTIRRQIANFIKT